MPWSLVLVQAKTTARVCRSQGHSARPAASGIDIKQIQDVHTFHDYTRPLLELLASLDEQVILVGHSFGGMSLALAMDLFPHKISVAVFLTAFMPDTIHRPSYVIEKNASAGPEDPRSLGFETVTIVSHEQHVEVSTMSPNLLASYFYQLSPVEGLELAKTLVRPGSLYLQELSKAKNFTDEGYGSVIRVFVVCNEDKTVSLKIQRWMIQNNPPKDVAEIKGAVSYGNVIQDQTTL